MLDNHKELSHFAKNISLLYVEDEKETREQYEGIFKLLYKNVKVVEDGEMAFAEYSANPYDLLVTDLTMPKLDGINLIDKILEINPHQHIIIMTAHNTDENLRYSIDFQVDGVLLKPVPMDKLFQLLYKISHMIDIEKKESKIRTTDNKLTNLLENMNQALFVVVVDKFLDIIKKFGVETKNLIIEGVKEHLINFGVEEEDILHLRDDVIVCGVDKRYLDAILESVQSFSDHTESLVIKYKDMKIYVSLSYGVILVKENNSVENIGENFLVHIDSIVKSIRDDENSNMFIKMDIDLEEARKNNTLSWLRMTLDALLQETILPFYQPIFDIHTLEIASYEIYARIKQGDKYILPEFFIDLSQKAGILEEISHSVFKKSFKSLAPTQFPFHINISDCEWRNNAAKEYLTYLCAKHSIEPSRVILDIINYESLQPSRKRVKFWLDLKAAGFKLAIKGFGSGNMNIEVLSILQPKYIKVNQLLLRKSLSDANIKRSLLFSLDYAKNANITTILVGVEDEEILNEGRKLGFDYIRGYLTQKPSSVL